MIALKNVTYIYPGKVIPTLDRIDFSFASSGFYLIEGASGAGKSTLLRLMSGFHRPAEGTILYGDIDLFSLKESERTDFIRNNVEMIFQDFQLLSRFTVRENILLNYPDISEEDVDAVLKRVRMESLKDAAVRTLSTGEKQRAAIARGLAGKKRVLLCDEITSNLDFEQKTEILDLLKDLSSEMLVICVSHETEIYRRYADRAVLLKDGHVIGETSPDDKAKIVWRSDRKNELNLRVFLKKYFMEFFVRTVLCALCFFLFFSSSGYLLEKDFFSYTSGSAARTHLIENQWFVPESSEEARTRYPHANYCDNSFVYMVNLPFDTFGDIPRISDYNEFTTYFNPSEIREMAYGRARGMKDEVAVGLDISSINTDRAKALIGKQMTFLNQKYRISGVYSITGSLAIELNLFMTDAMKDKIVLEIASNSDFFLDAFGGRHLRLAWTESENDELTLPLFGGGIYWKSHFGFRKFNLNGIDVKREDINSIKLSPELFLKIIGQTELPATLFYEDARSVAKDRLSENDGFCPAGLYRTPMERDDLKTIGFGVFSLAVVIISFILAALFYILALFDRERVKDLKILSSLNYEKSDIDELNRKFIDAALLCGGVGSLIAGMIYTLIAHLSFLMWGLCLLFSLGMGSLFLLLTKRMYGEVKR